jgi:hypothetical protein
MMTSVSAELPGPPGWAQEDGQWFCLSCRRELIVEAHRGQPAAESRRALIEFELRRDPHASDQVIGQRARVSSNLVGPVRRSLASELRGAAPEQLRIEVGQVFEDPASAGRRLRVVSDAEDGRSVVVENVRTGRRSRIQLRRLHPRTGDYNLVAKAV